MTSEERVAYIRAADRLLALAAAYPERGMCDYWDELDAIAQTVPVGTVDEALYLLRNTWRGEYMLSQTAVAVFALRAHAQGILATLEREEASCEVRLQDGVIDEVVASHVHFHMEDMGKGDAGFYWWIGLTRGTNSDGTMFHIDISSDSPITIMYRDEGFNPVITDERSPVQDPVKEAITNLRVAVLTQRDDAADWGIEQAARALLSALDGQAGEGAG